MTIHREYQADLYDGDQLVDSTVIDDNDPEFAMELFTKEFGHTNLSDQAFVTIEPLGLFDVDSGDDVEDNKENQAKIEE